MTVFFAKDCCKIEIKKTGNAKSEDKTTYNPGCEFFNNIQRSINLKGDVFRFSNKDFTDDSPIVEFDFKERCWKAGRYIGYIQQGNDSLRVMPRFGEQVLYELIGDIFNIKMSIGHSRLGISKQESYVKLIISYVWQQKLTYAIRHGLPRTKKHEIVKGYGVNGTLMVLPSIFSYYTDKSLISQYEYASYDHKIIRILGEAHKILKKDYYFSSMLLSHGLKNVIKDIDDMSRDIKKGKLTEKDYSSIKYSPIYQAYKDVVDFSWQIIQKEISNNSQDNGKKISGCLIDMAEIWECYLRNVLKKHLEPQGWKLDNNEYHLYSGMFYHRNIIPDIIFYRDNKYLVFDAKYKKMTFEKEDVDRNDFFQIHTYISFLKTKGNVFLSGLLYPVQTKKDYKEAVTNLFNDPNDCKFIVYGPYIAKDEDSNDSDNYSKIDKDEMFDKINEALYDSTQSFQHS